MEIKSICRFLESYAPLDFQESYDNSGLITGSFDQTVDQALVSLDVTEAVIDEAIKKKCQLIVAHHPVIFKPIHKINGQSETERILIKAIKNDIAIYAAHTNLDIVKNGVNAKICEVLGLKDCRPLQQLQGNMRKFVVFVPDMKDDEGRYYPDVVRDALADAGAGSIGDYESCTFNIRGTGTFRPGEGANPFVGENNKLHKEEEIKIESIFPAHLQEAILSAMIKSHPYEEPAYDIYPLKNSNPEHGLGMVGVFQNPVVEGAFLDMIKETINCESIRHSALLNKSVKKVAVCGGSGGHLIREAIKKGVDAFITSDLKYHQFFEPDNKLLLVDAGHYETEACTIDLIYDILRNKFTNFAVLKTETITNPINYF